LKEASFWTLLTRLLTSTNVYYTPYKNNNIELWNGTYWVVSIFTEQTLALGTVTAARPYDVFGFINLTTEEDIYKKVTVFPSAAVELRENKIVETA
jgi:hypothetical protein